MKVVYVAGPYRSLSAWGVEQNVRKAEAVALEIARDTGLAVLCPHTMNRFYEGTLPDKYWLEATQELMLRADFLFMVDGWEKSTGSQAERMLWFKKKDTPPAYDLEELRTIIFKSRKSTLDPFE